MVALQIRNVPDDVRLALVEQARARGQSLRAFLLSLAQTEARRSANLALLDRFARRDDGSRLSAAQATYALDAARTDRAGRLADPAGPLIGDR
jgi:antitoxin FitA